MSVNILFISYGPLLKLIRAVQREYGGEVRFYNLDVTPEQLPEEVMDFESNHRVDVIISSGTNASTARRCEAIKAPIVEISYSGFDLMYTLLEARRFSDRVALISYQEPNPYVQDTKSLLRIQLKEYVYKERGELEELLGQVRMEGIENIVSTSYVCRIAEELRMRGHLLWRAPSIRSAIDNAVSMARVQRKNFHDAESMKALFDNTYEGIFIITGEGKVENVNLAAEKLLGVPARQIVGKQIGTYIKDLDIRALLTSGQERQNAVCRINDIKIFTNQIPIILRGEITGAVITAQVFETITKINDIIARSLVNSGLVAKTRIEDMDGSSELVTDMKRKARLFARSQSNIMLSGEIGVGKSALAESIHNLSVREHKPFVRLNCASRSVETLENDLFGVEDSTPGQVKPVSRLGYLELANGGTLFLDDVGELPMSIQAKLLRVLEQSEIQRVGGQRPIRVDVRIIAASNIELLKLVEEGLFRKDLYYRLNVLEIRVPALRERWEDIPILAGQYLKEFQPGLEETAVHRLAASPLLAGYAWPGNLRELRNIMERLSVLYEPGCDERALLDGILNVEAPVEECAERERIRSALTECGDNKAEAAKKLGISRSTLWRRERELGLSTL